MFPFYSRLSDRLKKVEQRLAGPASASDPQILLDHIVEVSKNARATWFGLLGLLAFVGVTLLAHKDADFFAYGAETQLPLIGIKVPVEAFFVFAPLLVAELYAYLPLYLMTLWDGLARAPAQIDGDPLVNRVFPWLLSHAALWYRNRRRGDGCAAPRVLGELVVVISFALGSLFGVAVLALLFDRDAEGNLTEQQELFTGTWIAREDGGWIDKVTGQVSGPWVEQPDGTWIDTAEQPD